MPTDDAYARADLSLISAKITGYVADIPVAANQHVEAGDVLLRIDDGDYRIALEQAQARLAELSSTPARIDAQVAAAESNVAQAEAQLAASEAVLTAAPHLRRTHAGSGGAARGLTGRSGRRQRIPCQAEVNRNAARAVITRANAQVEGPEIEGSVVSVAPATGAAFSLLPADNATGNFTKIVQRVPSASPCPRARPACAGLSVEIAIDTRTGPDAAREAATGAVE